MVRLRRARDMRHFSQDQDRDGRTFDPVTRGPVHLEHFGVPRYCERQPSSPFRSPQTPQATSTAHDRETQWSSQPLRPRPRPVQTRPRCVRDVIGHSQLPTSPAFPGGTTGTGSPKYSEAATTARPGVPCITGDLFYGGAQGRMVRVRHWHI